MPVGRIDIEELRKKVTSGKNLIVVDVREKKEIGDGGIPGAIHIPMSEVEARMPELRKTATLVFY